MSLQSSDNPLDWKFVKGKLVGEPMLRLNEETGCWLWQGFKDRGYGRVQISSRLFSGIRMGTKGARDGWLFIWIHQLTYFMKHGNPPKDTELDHSCLRRCCANPDHIEAVTPTENKLGRFVTPELSTLETEAIIEKLLEEYPNKWIANNFGVSIWAVRRIAESLKSSQVELPLEVPF